MIGLSCIGSGIHTEGLFFVFKKAFAARAFESLSSTVEGGDWDNGTLEGEKNGVVESWDERDIFLC